MGNAVQVGYQWFQFNDSTFESGPGRFGNVYDSVRSSANNSTSMFENLQSQLKQRDGIILLFYLTILFYYYYFLNTQRIDLIRYYSTWKYLQGRFNSFNGNYHDAIWSETP